jgi:hypothetical protein
VRASTSTISTIRAGAGFDIHNQHNKGRCGLQPAQLHTIKSGFSR